MRTSKKYKLLQQKIDRLIKERKTQLATLSETFNKKIVQLNKLQFQEEISDFLKAHLAKARKEFLLDTKKPSD